MNSYLSIASEVLREARRPMSAAQILKAAYQLQIVPRHLFGRTQHKTLHARLSEDILKRRSESSFSRTGPGRFVLRAMLRDPALPKRYRDEYLAPIRADQLKRFHVLCTNRWPPRTNHAVEIPFSELKSRTFYRKLIDIEHDDAILYFRILVVLHRGDEILIHRRAFEFGDSLDATRSIGLLGYVKRDDFSLFSSDDLGIQDAANRTLSEQLHVPYRILHDLHMTVRSRPFHCIIDQSDPETLNTVVAVLFYNCSDSSELDAFIEGLSDQIWHRAQDRLNSVESFDPWSRLLLQLLESSPKASNWLST